MTRNPKTLSIDTSLTDALKLMNKQSITNYLLQKYEAIRNYSFTRYTVSSMKYSFVIKFIKYFLLFVSILFFQFLHSKLFLQQKKNENIVSFESEQFSSASQILSKPLFMGLDKKKTFKISALKATRFNNNQDEFNLENPKGRNTN